MTLEKLSSIKLKSFVDQFVLLVGGGVDWVSGMDRYFSQLSCDYHFIRVHDNLVQHPSNNKSIIILVMHQS